MDVVEFLKEGTMMFNSYESCVGCPMYPTDDCCMVKMNLKQMISIVEQWAKAHPIKTRQSEFLKMFPNARIDDGVIFLGPCAIDKSHKCTLDCKKCCRDYWLKEIE